MHLYSTTWYCVYILSTYVMCFLGVSSTTCCYMVHFYVFHSGVCRVWESIFILLHGIVSIFYHPMWCVLWGYHPRLALLYGPLLCFVNQVCLGCDNVFFFNQVFVGCENFICMLPHGFFFIFAHPTLCFLRVSATTCCHMVHFCVLSTRCV